ncbi:hypothetical protein L593_03280 [Salinarchaeum sp. Harcht-Bsk1]|uniref:DUF7315 family membrane protein n=1 Tax=Salinarchaeum sp. Harcht-Bsk1 TaxID=1333523 RepID=UPI00034245A2|nr:hypothetical protein [Salinarchaeum sp. Harcht-Bsk1]AGN00607.1 hypothetical protein L593_03280 [Salinarchaeum sp. Harcht-Bsk1]
MTDDRTDDERRSTDAASNDPFEPPEPGSDAPAKRAGRPEVVVPMDLYKTITVFSTLFAIALVVGGMIALDAATGRASRAVEDVNLPIAFLGVAAIVLGAATYAFAARFRAEGMGNPKDGDDER